MNSKYRAALVFVIVLVMYLLTLSENLAIAHDSSMYINWIEKSQFLFTPHHLLYTIAMRLWLSFCELLLPAGNDIVFLSLPNALAGAASATLIYHTLTRNAGIRPLIASIGTAGVVFSFGFWFYSVAIEVYLIPLLFLLIAFYLVTKPDLSKDDIWKIGIAHALGILFHQAHVLMYAALVITLLLRSRSLGLSRVKTVLVYTTWSAIPTIIAYLAVIVWDVKARSVADGWYWLTLYSHELSGSWNTVSMGSLFEACIGFGRAFIGAHFVFAIPAIQRFVTSSLKGKWFDDEMFLVGSLNESTAIMLVVLSGIIVLLIVYLATSIIRRKSMAGRSTLVLPAFVWLISYSIFFYFWDATNCEFWIPQTVCVWILLSIGLDRIDSKRNRVAFISCVCLLAVVNFAGSIRFAQSKEYDYYYHRVEPFLKSSSSDLVVLSNSWTIQKYFEYYTKVSTLSISSLLDSARKNNLGSPTHFAAGAIRSELSAASQRDRGIYVMSDAVKFKEVALIESSATQDQIDSIWSEMRPCLISRIIGDDTLYLYKCP